MMPAFANHLWQSTVVAAVAALLALALRTNHARARYWLWMAASLKFLVPFSLLVEIGSQWHWRTAVPVAAPQVSLVMRQITEPFPHTASAASLPAVPVHHEITFAMALAAVWMCGFAVVLFSWWRRWLRVRAAVREATPLAVEQGVPVLLSPALLEPGVFGVFRPVLLLPRGITEHLSTTHLRAIIAHELCHIRRRDNLAAALHMAVEALFWFHPLVWWIGGRLVEERERACDEEVLRQGSSPEVYAESILRTCQFFVESPLACMSGITGADLKQRIVRIMTPRAVRELSAARKLLLGAIAALLIAAPLFLGSVSHAQSQPRPAFEVASIKENHSDDRRMAIRPSTGRFEATNVPAKLIIEFAYNVKGPELSGGPAWISSEHYDVDAKIDDAQAEQMRKLSPDDRDEQLRLMLQSLLADRFGLKLSRQMKDLPIYNLVVAKSGPKFHESKDSGPPIDPSAPPPQPPTGAGPQTRPRMGPGMAMMRPGEVLIDGPVSRLADILTRIVGKEVVDKTGLTANYDIKHDWMPDHAEGGMMGGGPGPGPGPGGPPPADAPPPPDPNAPDLFTALQEQLGLKLESAKAPVETFVIDHIERPSAN